MPRLFAACALLTLLAACAPRPSVDAAAVVQAAYDKLAAGDVDGFMAFFAPQAVMEDGDARYEGARAIRLHVENDLLPAHIRIELSNVAANGNVVTYIASIYIGNVLLANEPSVDVVSDGKIVYDGTQLKYGAECRQVPRPSFCAGQ